MITARQLCIVYAIYSLAVKVISLPSLLYSAAGNLAWLAAAAAAAVEVLLVFIATLFLPKAARKGGTAPAKTDTPSAKTGGTNAVPVKIAYAVFIPVLLLELLVAVKNISAEIPYAIFILTLVFTAIFFAARPPQAFFRACEILWLFVLLAFVIAIIPTIYGIQADFSTLIDGDTASVLPAVTGSLLYFESAIFVFIFAAETADRKHLRKKIITTSALCAVFFTAFTAFFVLLFGPLAAEKTNALADLTLRSKYITDTGAFDWYISSSVLTMLILRFGVIICAVTVCVKKIFGIKAKSEAAK
jgi:hypothetical protein